MAFKVFIRPKCLTYEKSGSNCTSQTLIINKRSLINLGTGTLVFAQLHLVASSAL